jgi:hypothetical protein
MHDKDDAEKTKRQHSRNEAIRETTHHVYNMSKATDTSGATKTQPSTKIQSGRMGRKQEDGWHQYRQVSAWQLPWSVASQCLKHLVHEGSCRGDETLDHNRSLTLLNNGHCTMPGF